MAKKKNDPQLLRLPNNMQGTKEEKQGRGCGKMIMWGVIALVGLGIVGSLMPKTPQQLAATQTAAAAALAASDVPKSPTQTAIPPTATVTPYPDITMTATIPATFDQEEASLKELPAVTSVERIERTETGYWAMVTTWPKMNKESFAQLIQIQAGKIDIYPFRFAVRIDDGESEPLWWIYDDETFEWSSSNNPPEWVEPKVEVSEIFTATLAAPTIQQIHPKNCKTAVGQGLTAQQSAAEGLDRDGDGVACYGD